jgi:hypothetical protein
MTYAAFCVVEEEGIVLFDLVKPWLQRFVNRSEAQFVECVKLFFAAWPTLLENGALSDEAEVLEEQLEAVDPGAMDNDQNFWPGWIDELL